MSANPSWLAALALTATTTPTTTLNKKPSSAATTQQIGSTQASTSNSTSTQASTLSSGSSEDDDEDKPRLVASSPTRRLREAPLKTFRSTDEFVAGWVAALINTTALFPINKLIFRQMAGGHKTQYAADQMKEEGLRYLYRGILPPLIQKMVTVSIMFGSFGHYRQWADRKFTDSPPIANLALAAIMTGSTEAVLTPLERVQMLLQDRSFHKNYKNTFDALLKLRLFGYSEYYRGLTCVLMRNGPSNILFFGLRDEIKGLLRTWSQQAQQNNSQIQSHNNESRNTDSPSHLNKNNNNLLHSNQIVTNPTTTIEQIVDHRTNSEMLEAEDSILHDFLAGAILGACISTLFYPLSVVRTRMQTRAPGTEFLSIVKAFKAVYSERDRKFSRLFHGCSINVLRQFVSWGVINCSYEFVLNLLHNTD